MTKKTRQVLSNIHAGLPPEMTKFSDQNRVASKYSVIAAVLRLSYWKGSINGQLTMWSEFIGRAMLVVSISSPR